MKKASLYPSNFEPYYYSLKNVYAFIYTATSDGAFFK